MCRRLTRNRRCTILLRCFERALYVPLEEYLQCESTSKSSILCLGGSSVVIEFNNGQSKNERDVILYRRLVLYVSSSGESKPFITSLYSQKEFGALVFSLFGKFHDAYKDY